ncbi:alpha/beta fold hydrolase [Stigmatella hybrida]|uniref:alpha/beta fold hydrolase n=1 Tax=Stigmatella hybrida TaxID=394097 RepID=UPI001CDB2474|nr:alpha/beta hydrolase [Stigmatella hybrida]
MYAEVSGARLFFDTEGPEWEESGPELRRRPTLLILHGGPGIDHSPYRQLGRAVSDRLHVVYLDHRANGRSETGDRRGLTLDGWAEDIHGFVAALGLHRPIVLGHSFGGYVAQAYAAAHPDQPGGLILAGTAPRFVLERALAAFERLGGAAAADTASRFFRRPAEHFPEYMERCYPLYGRTAPGPQMVARMVMNMQVADSFVGGEMQTFDLRDRLARITAPVLILSAADDVIATPADVAELKEHLRAPCTEVRFDAGHEMLRDEPARAAAVIRGFALDVERPHAGAPAGRP